MTELADATKSQIARMAAGLQLKNQLTSKDATVRLQYQQRWLSLDEGVKTHVKNMVRELQNCDDSSDRFHACLNVVFYVIDWVLLPVFVLKAVQTLGTEIARPAIAPQVKNKVKIQQIRDAVTGLLKAWVKFFFHPLTVSVAKNFSIVSF